MSVQASKFTPRRGQGAAQPGGLNCADTPMDRGRPRIALYSHDTQGLGHVRRNLLVARALRQGGAASAILLLSGVREAAAFAMPEGVDCMTLPSLGKGVDGRYFPRSLSVPMTDLIKIRREAIDAVLQSFEPDVLIVDKVPLGAFDELLPSLRLLRRQGQTRVVLGLREILDDPAVVRQEWTTGGYESAISAYYDRIWIYGDQMAYDSVREYGFSPDIAAMVRFSGYLNPQHVERGPRESDAEDRTLQSLHLPPGPLALCLVGGGQDGLPLAEAFLRAALPAHANGVLVTGPLMPDNARAKLRSLAAHRTEVRILEFVTDPCPLLRRADRVIAMGGYNTICEILALQKHALIVPRIRPRTEQLIRAACLADLGVLDMLHPQDLSPAALSEWLAGDNASSAPGQGVGALDFEGVLRLPSMLEELLAVHRPDTEVGHAVG